MTQSQALWAVRGAANFLYRHIRFETANDQERELWQRIRAGTGQEQNKEALRIFRDKQIMDWWRSQRGLIPTERVEVEEVIKEGEVVAEELIRLTNEEAAVLVALINYRDGTLVRVNSHRVKFEVGGEMRAAAKNLIARVDIFPGQRESYLALRETAIAKLQAILRAEKIEEFIDQHDDAIQTLLIWLWDKDIDVMTGLIDQFLAQPPANLWQEERGEVVKFWREIQLEAQSVTWEPPATRPRERNMERRDPQVHQRLNEFLDQIAQLKITKPVSTAQLTKFFPVLKAILVDQMEEKGYIKPQRGRDHRHPVLSHQEIAILLYIAHFGNNLTPHLVKELAKIIQEEMAKRQ